MIFKYLSEKVTRLNDAKVNQGIFVKLQIRQFVKDSVVDLVLERSIFLSSYGAVGEQTFHQDTSVTERIY